MLMKVSGEEESLSDLNIRAIPMDRVLEVSIDGQKYLLEVANSRVNRELKQFIDSSLID